jgi:polar amino acid transport system substrate-binding protein
MATGSQGGEYSGAVSATPSRARSLLLACMIIGASVLCAHASGEKELLAPTGKLRVGVYHGSPTSMVTDAKSGQTHGLTYDLGREFATRLNVPVEYVTFQRIADVIDAMRDGQLDFTVTNATPVRKEQLSFSQLLVAIELGYLVPANSSIRNPDEMDQPGIRIGVTKGGTSERTLSAKFKNAKVIPAESVKLATEMLRRGELDVYATNKAVLFEMSDQMPGARVLDGNWGFEHMSVAIPRGREQGLPFVESFVREVQGNSLLEKIEQESGLRGAVKAEP